MQINIPTGGSFDLDDLIKFINLSGRNYIIQGQISCVLGKHSKPQSLDYWLREHVIPLKINTKRAENAVLIDLIATGFFKAQRKLLCPDSHRNCKGLVVVTQS